MFNDKEIGGLTASEYVDIGRVLARLYTSLLSSNAFRTSKALVLLHVTSLYKYRRDCDDPSQLRVAEN